jgi:hypothetical protein
MKLMRRRRPSHSVRRRAMANLTLSNVPRRRLGRRLQPGRCTMTSNYKRTRAGSHRDGPIRRQFAY